MLYKSVVIGMLVLFIVIFI